MAVFLLQAITAAAYAPRRPSGTVFDDVSANAFAADWIEALALEGITSGCHRTSTAPARQSVGHRWRSSFSRPASAPYSPPPHRDGLVRDVPPGSFAAAWIEDLGRRGSARAAAAAASAPARPSSADRWRRSWSECSASSRSSREVAPAPLPPVPSHGLVRATATTAFRRFRVDPVFDPFYQGFYLLGLRELATGRRLTYSNAGFPAPKTHHCLNFVVEPEGLRVSIDTQDRPGIYDSALGWCDVYGKINVDRQFCLRPRSSHRSNRAKLRRSDVGSDYCWPHCGRPASHRGPAADKGSGALRQFLAAVAVSISPRCLRANLRQPRLGVLPCITVGRRPGMQSGASNVSPNRQIHAGSPCRGRLRTSCSSRCPGF